MIMYIHNLFIDTHSMYTTYIAERYSHPYTPVYCTLHTRYVCTTLLSVGGYSPLRKDLRVGVNLEYINTRYTLYDPLPAVNG